VRRAALALLGTAVGTSLLVGAKLGTPVRNTAGQVTTDPGAGAPGDPSGAPVGDPAAPAPTGSAGPNRTAPSAPAGRSTRPTPAGGTRTQTAPKPPAPAGLKSGTYTGNGVSHEYGTVQVTITVSGGVVTKASATYPTDRSTSRSINNGAVPTLNSRAVAAKTSSSISTVSGATLTSDAYKSSLQSALDKAKA
jgi:uncharacterized protein with FMN-binding domain